MLSCYAWIRHESSPIAVSVDPLWLLLWCGFCSITSVKIPASQRELFFRNVTFVWICYRCSIIVSVTLVNPFHRHEHRSVCLRRSLLSGIKVLLIGVIIPLYADSLSLNPLRSTLCHAWLTCLRWCQVLAVSRRLPYATVLLSPLMSVKWMSARVEDSVRCGAHPETHWQWHAFSHTVPTYICCKTNSCAWKKK